MPSAFRPPRRGARWLLLAAALAAVAAGSFFTGAVAHRECWFPFCEAYHLRAVEALTGEPAVEARVVHSSLHDVRFTPVPIPVDGYGYAALDAVGDGVLLAAKGGTLVYVGADRRATPLGLRIPFSRERFDARVRGTSERAWFGVKDLRALPAGEGRVRLVVSYHHWDDERSCSTLRVDQAVVPAPPAAVPADAAWTRVLESWPCLPLKEKGWSFGGHQAGGRIEPLGGGRILLSVGDQEFDGTHGPDRPQDPASAQGKTFVVELATGRARLFTLGHRNPQGLHVDAEGTIWETEHGPTGGDELNVLVAGANYGWPRVTYGTAGAYTRIQGSHPGFRQPVHAWVPSIGISQVIRVRGERFDRWRGDLLVSSLRAQTLFRLRPVGDRVAFAEPIVVGERVRDVLELPDGTVAVLTENPSLYLLTPEPRTAPPPAPTH